MGVKIKIEVLQNGWFIINGKPYEQMDDLEGKPTIFGNTHIPVPWMVWVLHCCGAEARRGVRIPTFGILRWKGWKENHGNLRCPPPKLPPPINKALLMGY